MRWWICYCFRYNTPLVLWGVGVGGGRGGQHSCNPWYFNMRKNMEAKYVGSLQITKARTQNVSAGAFIRNKQNNYINKRTKSIWLIPVKHKSVNGCYLSPGITVNIPLAFIRCCPVLTTVHVCILLCFKMVSEFECMLWNVWLVVRYRFREKCLRLRRQQLCVFNETNIVRIPC